MLEAVKHEGDHLPRVQGDSRTHVAAVDDF
jgi:hypothetical protein